MPTVPTAGVTDDTYFKFEDKDTEGPQVSFQLLEKLQVIANNFIKERQEAGRRTVQKFLETSTPVGATVDADDGDDLEDGAEGLDQR